MDSWNLSSISSWLLITLAAVLGFYKYLTWKFGIFKRLGINGPMPYFGIGTIFQSVKLGLMKHDLDLKRKYGSVVGIFRGHVPMLMIYDVEILKQILVRDFSNFTNRLNFGTATQPLNKMVIALGDDHWKHVRNHLTPTFSSGKLRKMNAKVTRCVETLLANLQKKAEDKEIFDFRQLTGAYTMDVIASTAFGLQIDSHNDPNNQFVQMGKKAFNFNFISLRTLVLVFFPYLMKPLSKLGVAIFPKEVTDFFSSAVDQAMKERKNTVDSDDVDFIQLMLNAKVDEEDNSETSNSVNANGAAVNGKETWKKRGLTHDEILAQGILFFLAGFETTATTLAFFGYHLALSPEIQDKLIKEIDEVMKDQKHVTYDLVQKMPYLDMCLNEVLRMYPVVTRTDRVTKNDTVINGLFIPKGMAIGVPIYAIQNDPEVWPNPEIFDPERFSPEAKESRHPLSYIPFGFGPRICIGMRLALMELKISMVHILQRMKFVRCEKTQVPLKLNKVRPQAVDGIMLRIERR